MCDLGQRWRRGLLLLLLPHVLQAAAPWRRGAIRGAAHALASGAKVCDPPMVAMAYQTNVLLAAMPLQLAAINSVRVALSCAAGVVPSARKGAQRTQ